MKRNLFCLLLLLTSVGSVSAQQQPQFSQYMFNQFYLNPALAGNVSKWMEASLIHRTQWANYQGSFDEGGAPETQVFTLSLPFSRNNFGIGLNLLNDKLGGQTNQEIGLSAAYYIPIKNGKLSFGMRLSAVNYQIDYDVLRFVDPNDPLAQNTGVDGVVTYDLGAGLYYQTPLWFAGVGATHLQQTDLESEGIGLSSLSLHYNVIAGLNFNLGKNIELQPSVLVKSDLNAYSFELSTIATYNEKIYGGLSLREDEAMALIAGMYFMDHNRLRVGYAYDYTLKQVNAKQRSSHEIMLSFRLFAPYEQEPSIIRTPRFRH
ncbi:PorP/SprF family type IX secretion system membrane protein [Sediminitomix flava]|uniref:Type IX secretion system PorP/SprF family membrane protein n=1 Tax=Sediminitomix flava TaxID=379075 RepID=A0A315Z756_SEDFL|nr:type IX secretion system membrane protein PorP/SprF [Sediminitomix flava]PWJ40782.1 type IX secretion system PorP/SprF family membrane protein [Sediminitomix flava]